MQPDFQQGGEEAPKPETAPQTPAPQTAPEEKTAKPSGGVHLWVKMMTVLCALSLLAAIPVILRSNHVRAAKIKSEDLSEVAGMIGKKEGIGWVTLRGVIMESDSSSPFERGASQAARKIRSLGANNEVKAIVLDINSPGGSVGAVQEIYDTIRQGRAEKKKPVIALFRDVSASGGYYIGSACDKIIAQPGTLTGSIGVILSVANIEGLLTKIGVKMDPVKSGKFKDIASPYRQMSPEERKLLQDMIDDSFAQFVTAVATGRNIPEDKVREIADGRVFTGRQAKELNLVDKLGGTTVAIKTAAEMAGLGDNPRIIRDTVSLGEVLSALESRFGGGMLGLEKAGVFATPKLAYLWTM